MCSLMLFFLILFNTIPIWLSLLCGSFEIEEDNVGPQGIKSEKVAVGLADDSNIQLGDLGSPGEIVI